MAETSNGPELICIDPFRGNMVVNQEEAHSRALTKLEAGEVQHNYEADKFIKDMEAAYNSDAFQTRYISFQNSVIANIHMYCGEQHMNPSQTAVNSEINNPNYNLDNHAGHNHADGDPGHDHKHESEEKDKKKKKKYEVKGWLGRLAA